MHITIICVGKIKEKFFRDAVDEYVKRLSRFAKVDIAEIKDEKIPDNASEKEMEAILEKEGNAILSKIPKNSMVAAMCIEGTEISSTQLAEKMKSAFMQTSNMTFIIGGSLGLWEKVKQASDWRMSFGKITLPHQLMRVVLAEQIYRAFKINANESYHK